jgi:hypothetical protein
MLLVSSGVADTPLDNQQRNGIATHKERCTFLGLLVLQRERERERERLVTECWHSRQTDRTFSGMQM